MVHARTHTYTADVLDVAIMAHIKNKLEPWTDDFLKWRIASGTQANQICDISKTHKTHKTHSSGILEFNPHCTDVLRVRSPDLAMVASWDPVEHHMKNDWLLEFIRVYHL